MQEVKFKSNTSIMNYSYDVCEVIDCENRSAKIIKYKMHYHNVCAECYVQFNR